MTWVRATVLVVDDSPATLGLLHRALEDAGYTVLVVQEGAAALALVGRVTPDIVLMDALMPGLDGFETCRRMKALSTLKTVPIVFMTGLTETEHVIRGLEAGGVDYVTKPVAPDEVIARIQVHLANARLTRSAQVALDTAGRFLLAVDNTGRVLWSTPQATRLLENAGGSSAVLPGAATAWIQHFVRNPAGRPPASAFRLVWTTSAKSMCHTLAKSPPTNCCCGWWQRRVPTRSRCCRSGCGLRHGRRRFCYGSAGENRPGTSPKF